MEWRTFDLHPEYPPEGFPRKLLEQRYGNHFTASVYAMIEEAGLPVSREIEIVPNGRKALLLAELARDAGRFAEFREATFAAYWMRGENIGDHAVLKRLAAEAGLDEHEVMAELVEQQHLDRLQTFTNEMLELGGGGVPAWVIDRRILIPGAQPHELFERILGGLGHEPRDGVGSPGA